MKIHTMKNEIMADSYYQDPKPACCIKFIPKFCGAADSTYCSTCGRWFEAPYDYIPRGESHEKNCSDIFCAPPAKCGACQHSLSDHGKSIKLKKLSQLSEQEIKNLMQNMMLGKSCDKCDCEKWVWPS